MSLKIQGPYLFNTPAFGSLSNNLFFFVLLYNDVYILHIKKLIQIGVYLDIPSAMYFESLWPKHYMYYKTDCSTDSNNIVDKCKIFRSYDF